MNRYGILLLCALGACSQEQVVTTTRNIDRPGPLALVCAGRVGDAGTTVGLTPSACTSDAGVGEAGGPKGTLYGFVANTSRGEVALFRPSASGEPLVDLDRRSPGFGTIPVGAHPSDLKATRDGCRVVTANVGSCDLSLIDVPAVLRVAAGEQKTPSGAAVSHVTPRTAAGPLRSPPQEIWIVPSSGPAKQETDRCPDATGSYRAYVTFPRCNLVAEIDLSTGLVAQGLLVRPDGFVLTKDPVCPVDCVLRTEPSRVDAGPPRDARPPDQPRPDLPRLDLSAPDLPGRAADGVPPRANDTRPANDLPAPDAPRPDGPAPTISTQGPMPFGLAVTESADRIYVSSAGASFISVIDVDAKTGAFTNPRRISVGDGAFTTRIRVSPPTRKLGRFLYALGSDRTLRIFSADLEKECEANLDLHRLPDGGVPFDQARCFVAGAKDSPRRIGVTRGGFQFGNRIPQEVAFISSPRTPSDAGVPEAGHPATPLHGIFAIVAVSDGTTYVIDVEDWNFVDASDGGVGRLPTSHLPHRFRNELQGTANGVPDASVASITNAGQGGVPAVVSVEIPAGAEKGVSLPGEGIYLRAAGEPVVADWSLVYEDRLLGRWSGDLSLAPERFSLSDPGVNFCASGVLGRQQEDGRSLRHGDIVVLVGCKDDTECGLEQVCVKPVAQQAETGLCLDKSRSDALFKVCADFLRGQRELLVTRAARGELLLDALPVEPQRVIRQDPQPAGGCQRNEDCQPSFLCALRDQPNATDPSRVLKKGECFRPGCTENRDCGSGFCVAPLDGSPSVCAPIPLPIETGPACKKDDDCRPKTAAASSCGSDSECKDVLLECRRPSNAAVESRCLDKGMVCASFPGLSGRCVRKSPCFAELQRYDVRVGRSFLVGGYRRTMPDPKTDECVLDGTRSPLLQERIPVGLPVYPVVLGPTCQTLSTPLVEPLPNPCFEWTSAGYGGYIDKVAGATPAVYTVPGPAAVVRYGNPDIWLSLGLSHLTALGASSASSAKPDGGVGEAPAYPPMPERGLTLALSVQSGFSRLRVPTSSIASLPFWIVEGPDGYVYLVDIGDRSGNTGNRGQVIRFLRSTVTVDSFSVK